MSWPSSPAATFLTRGRRSSSCPAPTLLHGERDIVPRREAEQAARDAGGELVMPVGTGHLFFAEVWEAFDRAASGWLDGPAGFPDGD